MGKELKHITIEGSHGGWNDSTRTPNMEIEEFAGGIKFSINGVNERGEPGTISIKITDTDIEAKLKKLLAD
jgi:hypothetical protein